MDTPKNGHTGRKRIFILGAVIVFLIGVFAVLFATGVIHVPEFSKKATSFTGTERPRSDASATTSEMAYRQYYLGDVDGAIATLNKALDAAPANSSDRLYLLRDKGNIDMSAKRYDDAIATYTLAVAIDPNNAVTLEGLGQAYQAAGRRDEARATYEKQLTAAKKTGLELQIEDATANLQGLDS